MKCCIGKCNEFYQRAYASNDHIHTYQVLNSSIKKKKNKIKLKVISTLFSLTEKI